MFFFNGVKTSDTSASFATTGIGPRLDLPGPEWLLMKVTAVGTSGGFNVYSLEEVEPVLTTYGYQTKPGGFTTSYAAEVNNATVAVNTVVFARFRSVHSTVGETWEFGQPATGSGSTLTHHTWGGTGTTGSYLPVSVTGWSDGYGNFALASSGLDILTGPSIPDGKTVRGTVSVNCKIGDEYQLYSIVAAVMSASVTGGSMTIGNDGAGVTVGEFPAGTSAITRGSVVLGDTSVGTNTSVHYATLTARYHFVNATGTDQNLTVRLLTLDASAWAGNYQFGYQVDLQAVIRNVAFYYTLEDT